MTTRREHDLWATAMCRREAYYGVHTLRAVENFPITGNPDLDLSGPDPQRWPAIKQSPRRKRNRELGLLDARTCRRHRRRLRGDARRAGCTSSSWSTSFRAAPGTSTNMNANEVIANRALELLGHRKGEYKYLHPNEHVNMSQSTNDVYPTALKVAAYFGIFAAGRGAWRCCAARSRRKAEEFDDVLKMGRTQLQDAVPMTLGQEFSTYAVMLGEDEQRLKEAALLIREINLGATAIGTGINAHPDYAGLVCRHLRKSPAFRWSPRPNLVEATQDCGALRAALGRAQARRGEAVEDLQRSAAAVIRSARRTWRDQPAADAGGLVSIMPGKVNPVIPEVVNQIAFEVIGNDVTVSFAAEAGQLQLNAFEPIIAHSLFKSVNHLRNGCLTLGRALRQRHHRQSRAPARAASKTRSAS